MDLRDHCGESFAQLWTRGSQRLRDEVGAQARVLHCRGEGDQASEGKTRPYCAMGRGVFNDCVCRGLHRGRACGSPGREVDLCCPAAGAGELISGYIELAVNWYHAGKQIRGAYIKIGVTLPTDPGAAVETAERRVSYSKEFFCTVIPKNFIAWGYPI